MQESEKNVQVVEQGQAVVAMEGEGQDLQEEVRGPAPQVIILQSI